MPRIDVRNVIDGLRDVKMVDALRGFVQRLRMWWSPSYRWQVWGREMMQGLADGIEGKATSDRTYGQFLSHMEGIARRSFPTIYEDVPRYDVDEEETWEDFREAAQRWADRYYGSIDGEQDDG